MMANLGKIISLGLSDHEAEEKASPSQIRLPNSSDIFWESFLQNPCESGADTSGHNLQNSSRSSSIPTSPTNGWARKRENDRAYRERQKQEKKRMKTDLESLIDENGKLKIENGSLKQDNLLMNEILKSQAKEIDQLKADSEKLKYEYNKQNALVSRLSELLACPDLQLENQRLRYENAQLRHNASLDHRVSQLAEENGRLKLENRVLTVQKDALCGKLINDNR